MNRLAWVGFVALLTVPVARGLAQQSRSRRGRGRQPVLKFVDDLLLQSRPEDEPDPFEERIETERHDFTQSSKTVGRGVVQIESGYTYFYKDEKEKIDQSHTAPEMLTRIGISEDIEFRLRWNYAWQFRDDEDDVDSAQDMVWAFKLGVTDQYGWRPESALEIRFTAPTGGAGWSTDRVEFGLDYIYEWEVADGVTLAGSTGFSTSALDEFSVLPEEPSSDQFILWSQSVALGVELTESVTLYVEYFGLFTHALADNVAENFLNAGIDFYLTDDFVLDVRAGLGLTPDSDDLFAGVGGGVRF